MADLRILKLKVCAARCRLSVLRMVRAAGHGHVGGAMSAMEVVTALYFDKMNIDPNAPAMSGRDRFILSAGHKCMVQYAALAELGFFDKSVLDTYGALKTLIPGHPDMHKLPGVEANTGALGHGLSIATGMALALHGGERVYAVMGDGELAEGSNWEAAAAAAHYKADNLTLIVDFNGLQISGRVGDVMNFTPISERFRAFGWAAVDIDGNDMESVVSALDCLPVEAGKPSCIVAHTTKAKGIAALENTEGGHYWTPAADELERAENDMRTELTRLEAELEEALK